MTPTPLITPEGRLRLDVLHAAAQKPARLAPGEPRFWDDPYIATQMLKAHLDPETEAASRRPETIERTVVWIMDTLKLQPGMDLLDLGCGPGLYTKRFATRGLHVTGMDFSANSLAYARAHDPASTYLLQNYVTLDHEAAYDAVTLIYGDFCVLEDADRDRLLDAIRRALRPGGAFVLDVTTASYMAEAAFPNEWYIAPEGGFWKPGPHLVLQQRYHYPEDDTTLDQYLVIEEDGTFSAYHNWLHHYSPATLTPILEAHGFTLEGVYGDLTGAPYTPDSRWLGVVART
jgi:SAM-dependent methyltransferase